MANLLIVGNGFDLYHHLPTRYTDFLFFVNNWSTFRLEYARAAKETEPNQHLDISRSASGELIMKSIYDFANYKNAYSLERLTIFDKSRNNCWVEYFNGLLKSESIGNNWIDFEEEIQKALGCVEEYCYTYPKIKNDTVINFYLSSRTVEFIRLFNNFSSEGALRLGTIPRADLMELKERKKRFIDFMLSELNKLIVCLDIYIQEFVSRIKCDNYSEQIRALSDVYLLNFNYTDTYEHVYGSGNLLSSHSVHGNAYKDNIVLGIPDDSFDNTEYIYFQKYFQRIQKRTGSTYQSWLVEKYNPVPTESSTNDDVHRVVIFGHSLAETDKGILKDVFLYNSITEIVILFHSQNAYESMVVNLIKSFGKDFVISNTGSGRIKFMPLEPAKLVSTDSI